MTTLAPNIGTVRRADRWLLLVPIIADILFGLGPFILGGRFGMLFGFPGNDSFLYRCAGAAAFGYPVGLALGLWRDQWSALRLPVIATLVFNVASVVVCVLAIAGGAAMPVVYLILLASIAVAAITAVLLRRYADEPRSTPDISRLFRYGFILGGVLASLFGLLPLLIPVQFAQLVGYKGTDSFVIQQAGAASLGYGVMAFMALKSGAWQEVRLPTIMALIFNGLACVASVIALLAGDPIFIVALIGIASFVYTVMILIAIQRKGAI